MFGNQLLTILCLFTNWNQIEAGLLNGLFFNNVDNNCTRAIPSLPLEDFTRPAYVTGWTYPQSRCGSITINKLNTFGILSLYIIKLQYYELNDTTNSNPITETLELVQNPNKNWELEGIAQQTNNILRGSSVNDVIASNSKGFNIVTCPQASGNKVPVLGAIITSYKAKQSFARQDYQLSYSLWDQSFNITFNQVFHDRSCPPPLT